MKIFIDVNIQKLRFECLLYFTKKYNILSKMNINIVKKYNEADLILFLVNTQKNIINLENDHYLFKTKIPIILLERNDASITWVRDLKKIKNLKAIFKNRILRNSLFQNTDKILNGRYHYYLMNNIYKIKNINEKKKDIGSNFYTNNLLKIDNEDLHKIKCVLWDFHSSILSDDQTLKFFRFNKMNLKKDIDIYFYNKPKNNVLINKSLENINNILINQKKYKVLDKHLEKEEYEEKFKRCKIAVSYWSNSEWISMDYHAMYSGVILIKPNTDFVKQQPDIYQHNKCYIPCKDDYSDLLGIIDDVLIKYDSYKSMLLNNRKMVMELNEEKACQLFWEEIKKLYKD